MRYKIVIHRAGGIKTATDIETDPYPAKGLSDEEAEREAIALSNWLGTNIPGHIYDRLMNKKEGRRLSRIERVSRKLIQVRKAVSTLEDYHMLDKYIDEIESILQEGEEKSS